MSRSKDDRASRRAPTPPRGGAVEIASAWVLRTGVLASVLVMLVGLVMAFRTGLPPVEQMTSVPFESSLAAIREGIRRGEGVSVCEAGIYLLVLTPIVRVATSTLVFLFHEKDWLYTVVTLVVLAITLAGLVLLRV